MRTSDGNRHRLILPVDRGDGERRRDDDGASGKVYPKELEDHMWELYLYITNNMEYIMRLVLWSISNGGLQAGTYKTTDKGISWTKE